MLSKFLLNLIREKLGIFIWFFWENSPLQILKYWLQNTLFLTSDHKCKGELCLKIGNITAKIDRWALNVFLLCCQIILRNLLKTIILFQITRFCVFAQLWISIGVSDCFSRPILIIHFVQIWNQFLEPWFITFFGFFKIVKLPSHSLTL